MCIRDSIYREQFLLPLQSPFIQRAQRKFLAKPPLRCAFDNDTLIYTFSSFLIYLATHLAQKEAEPHRFSLFLCWFVGGMAHLKIFRHVFSLKMLFSRRQLCENLLIALLIIPSWNASRYSALPDGPVCKSTIVSMGSKP